MWKRKGRLWISDSQENGSSASGKTRLESLQLAIGIIISVCTCLISWQTFQLSARQGETTSQLKVIEQQLAENKFSFERVRDVYDRTEKYLSSQDQNLARGRVLVALIGSLPESSTRASLLTVVAETTTSDTIAATAATQRLAISTPTIKLPPPTAEPLTNPGQAHFTGNLSLRINEDRYTAVTISDITFTDSRAVEWKVPAGTVVSGSSVPRPFWSIIGPPLSSNYTIAVVLHEYYATKSSQPFEKVNQMFYEAMLTLGVKRETALVMYTAVTQFGPRWKIDGATPR
jgi:hypothetical protein